MEIVSISHVNVEEEILNPYCWISCAIILFNVDGLEVLGEFVLHNLIGETHGVCRTSWPIRIIAVFGW
jgi:hypothetical protein